MTILSRSQDIPFPSLTVVFRKDERTLIRWVKDFSLRRMASLFSGMVNNQHAGKLTREQKQEIRRVVSQPPQGYGIPTAFWNVPTLKTYVRATFGVVYESEQSYHYLLKFSGLSFKYPDTRSPRRNEQEIVRRIQEIQQEIAPLLQNDHWMVFASDETRIQLEAEIRRAWLKKGERTVVKTERSKEHQNYLGFLDQNTGHCQVFEIERGNQRESIRVLRKLVAQYPTKRVCVIWDNARCHKGKLLRTALGSGKKLASLHLINFPPYAPDHNPIEHVWQVAKKQLANRSDQLFEDIKRTFVQTISQRTFAYQI